VSPRSHDCGIGDSAPAIQPEDSDLTKRDLSFSDYESVQWLIDEEEGIVVRVGAPHHNPVLLATTPHALQFSLSGFDG
jgi:hypothetical protein